MDGEWCILTPDELEGLDPDERLDAIDATVEDVVQLAKNIEADFEEWGKIAKARVEARAIAGEAIKIKHKATKKKETA